MPHSQQGSAPSGAKSHSSKHWAAPQHCCHASEMLEFSFPSWNSKCHSQLSCETALTTACPHEHLELFQNETLQEKKINKKKKKKGECQSPQDAALGCGYSRRAGWIWEQQAGTENHGMIWVRGDLKAHPIPRRVPRGFCVPHSSPGKSQPCLPRVSP